MSKIQIGIACGENCEDYVNFLLKSIRKTISNLDYEIILGINKKCVNVDYMLKANKDCNIKVIMAIDRDKRSTAHGHGRTVDAIFNNMDSKYGMFVDCDCAFLTKNWDVEFINRLNDKNVVIGSEYDGGKYMNFPNIVCCMFLTDILKQNNISFVPRGKIVIDKNNSQIYGREVGVSITLDAGWQLCHNLKVAGYSGTTLDLARTCDSKGIVKTTKQAKFIQEGMRGEEYQLDGVPIVTHVGRSSIRNFKTHPIVIKWREEIENYE